MRDHVRKDREEFSPETQIERGLLMIHVYPDLPLQNGGPGASTREANDEGMPQNRCLPRGRNLEQRMSEATVDTIRKLPEGLRGKRLLWQSIGRQDEIESDRQGQ